MRGHKKGYAFEEVRVPIFGWTREFLGMVALLVRYLERSDKKSVHAALTKRFRRITDIVHRGMMQYPAKKGAKVKIKGLEGGPRKKWAGRGSDTSRIRTCAG